MGADLSVYEGNDRIVSNLNKIEEIDNLPPIQPINTGFPVLDEWIQGTVHGELVVFGGKPKSGKSLLMKTFIRNFSSAGKPPLVFSFEEQIRQFFESFENKSKDMLFYVPNELKVYDVGWIKERALEAKAKVGTEIIMIDHGHFLFQMSQTQSSLDIGDVARDLKRFAVENNFVIFLIWHLRKVKIESIEDYDMELLRDTGMLAGELDTILFLHRDVESDGLTQRDESYIRIECTRRSGVFKRVVPIRKEGAYFREADFNL